MVLLSMRKCTLTFTYVENLRHLDSNSCAYFPFPLPRTSPALFDSMHSNQASDGTFSPPRTLPSPTMQLRQHSEKPPWCK